MTELSDRWRWTILLSLVALGLAGATTVYFVTAHNRTTDRAAVLGYETQIIAPVRDVSVVAGSMADAATSYRSGKIAATTFTRTLSVYRAALQLDAGRIDAVRVPIAFGANAGMFAPIAHAYIDALDAYTAAAKAGSTDLAAADRKAGHALALYREAARALARARFRLGMPASANFGDPPRSIVRGGTSIFRIE